MTFVISSNLRRSSLPNVKDRPQTRSCIENPNERGCGSYSEEKRRRRYTTALPATRWSRPRPGRPTRPAGSPKSPTSERSRCWHSPPFRAGCERRGALQEASGGWDGFLCTQAIDRIWHRLPLSVQGDHSFRTAWVAHLSPRLNSRNRSTVKGEWFW